ncbi:MAG: rhomboid family intramembrane serine protease [Chloroflexi bacterium]|nr:rhomboid family intramembrane serine protease [Chloroflexota bacterium]
MIPLRDLNPTSRTAVVNRLLLLANSAAWIYVLTIQRSPDQPPALYGVYAFDWGTFTTAVMGGQLAAAGVPLVSHMFLHGGWLHLLGNMLYLWIFGDNVEDRLGSARYLVFYLASGFVAAIGQGLLDPAPMVGASGAISGVLAAYLVLHPGARISTLVFLGIFISVIRLPAVIVIGFYIVVQVIDGLAQLRVEGAASDIAYFAHVFGFVGGLMLVLLMRPRHPRSLRW